MKRKQHIEPGTIYPLLRPSHIVPNVVVETKFGRRLELNASKEVVAVLVEKAGYRVIEWK